MQEVGLWVVAQFCCCISSLTSRIVLSAEPKKSLAKSSSGQWICAWAGGSEIYEEYHDKVRSCEPTREFFPPGTLGKETGNSHGVWRHV